MIEVLLDHVRRIALVRLSGILTAADLSALGAAGRRHLTRHEALAWRILDFSAVEQVQVPTSFIASLGMARSIAGNRIYVVPDPETFGLARVYSSYQRHQANSNEPLLVATLDEAYAAIGCTPAFARYDVGQPVS